MAFLIYKLRSGNEEHWCAKANVFMIRPFTESLTASELDYRKDQNEILYLAF